MCETFGWLQPFVVIYVSPLYILWLLKINCEFDIDALKRFEYNN